MKIHASAPGKLMLFGEHSVVYGHPCIVTAVGKRINVWVENLNKKSSEDIIITPQCNNPSYVQETLTVFRKEYKIPFLKVETNGDFTHDVGLGSSSAVTIALIKALSELFTIKISKKEMFNMGYQVVQNVQKTGSGFDIASAAYGKTVHYKNKGEILEIISEKPLDLVVGYSGVKANTPIMIKKVEQIMKYNRSKVDTIFKQITRIVIEAKGLIEDNNYHKIGNLMTENHELLKSLKVSTRMLDAMVEAAVQFGAYGAKLSGAGGGDCMIALTDNKNKKNVENAILEVGGEIIHTDVCSEGARVEL